MSSSMYDEKSCERFFHGFFMPESLRIWCPHLVERHINKTDGYLISRFNKTGPEFKASSTFIADKEDDVLELITKIITGDGRLSKEEKEMHKEFIVQFWTLCEAVQSGYEPRRNGGISVYFPKEMSVSGRCFFRGGWEPKVANLITFGIDFEYNDIDAFCPMFNTIYPEYSPYFDF